MTETMNMFMEKIWLKNMTVKYVNISELRVEHYLISLDGLSNKIQKI